MLKGKILREKNRVLLGPLGMGNDIKLLHASTAPEMKGLYSRIGKFELGAASGNRQSSHGARILSTFALSHIQAATHLVTPFKGSCGALVDNPFLLSFRLVPPRCVSVAPT